MKSKNPKSKLTQSELAKILGISRQLVASHLRTGKAPALDDVDAWVDYLAANGRQGSLPREDQKKLAKERVRLLRAQVERVQLDNLQKRGEMIQNNIVQKFLHHLNGIFFGELGRLAKEFPATLKGKSEIEINVEVESQIDNIRKSLKDAISLWAEKKGKV